MTNFRRVSVLPVVAAAVALICGCQGSAVTTPPAPDTIPAAPPIALVARPATPVATDVALVNGEEAVTVGMTAKQAFKVFPDPRDGGLSDDELPQGFKDPYRARWWDAGTRGFGVITYDDAVVAAMYREESSSDARYEDWLQAEQKRMISVDPVKVEGSRVTYWFWEKDSQRVMLCAYKADKGVDITVAMGDNTVMDALGASKEGAESARKKIAALLERPAPAPTN